MSSLLCVQQPGGTVHVYNRDVISQLGDWTSPVSVAYSFYSSYSEFIHGNKLSDFFCHVQVQIRTCRIKKDILHWTSVIYLCADLCKICLFFFNAWWAFNYSCLQANVAYIVGVWRYSMYAYEHSPKMSTALCHRPAEDFLTSVKLVWGCGLYCKSVD